MENATSKKVEQIKKTTAKLLIQLEQLEALNDKDKLISNNNHSTLNANMNESTISRIILSANKLNAIDLIK